MAVISFIVQAPGLKIDVSVNVIFDNFSVIPSMTNDNSTNELFHCGKGHEVSLSIYLSGELYIKGGVGKTMLLLSACFCRIFIAIKQKNSGK
jgi:hypothetical protein